MTEEEKLDAGLPYDFCESGCKLRRNRTVFYALTNRAARYVSVTASIRQQRIGAAEGEELFVRSLLGDAAVLDDGDAVGIADG